MELKNIYKKLVLMSSAVCMALMTSCTDFLTIIPPDKIVHENFWQTKDEVNGMLATSYLYLASTDAVKRAIVWGELRSDNLTYPTAQEGYTGGAAAERYMVQASIDDENVYTQWGVFYKAINYANLVIEFAPLVVEEERDPDFTQGDLDVILGEMYAMRALCHFYLVRTFRDIPMAMVPAVNDSELPDYAQVHPLEALEMIMNDLDIAEKLVMESGNHSNAKNNYGRFTKNAVLAIKADVNLWRAAFTTCYNKNGSPLDLANVDVQTYYTKCIENCQAILDNLDKQFNKKNPNGLDNDLPYHLISNYDEYAIKQDTKTSLAYDKIFGSENSSESIFEIQIDKSLSKSKCAGISSAYGTSSSGAVIVPETFLDKYEKDDLRKYAYTNVELATGKASKNGLWVSKYVVKKSPAASQSRPSSAEDVDANWIVYRQTDVMLMMAEALVAQPSVSSDDIKKAFELVNAINLRSRADTVSSKIVNPLKLPADATTALALVLDERSRELAFEGKRWYDLVRKALRENSTENIKFVADKLTQNPAALKNKMVGIDNLFMPINIDELRFNKNLVQNPAYDFGDSSIGMKQ